MLCFLTISITFAFDVGQALPDQGRSDQLALHGSQAELLELIGVGSRTGPDPHDPVDEVDRRNGDQRTPGSPKRGIRMFRARWSWQRAA